MPSNRRLKLASEQPWKQHNNGPCNENVDACCAQSSDQASVQRNFGVLQCPSPSVHLFNSPLSKQCLDNLCSPRHTNKYHSCPASTPCSLDCATYQACRHIHDRTIISWSILDKKRSTTSRPDRTQYTSKPTARAHTRLEPVRFIRSAASLRFHIGRECRLDHIFLWAIVTGILQGSC